MLRRAGSVANVYDYWSSCGYRVYLPDVYTHRRIRPVYSPRTPASSYRGGDNTVALFALKVIALTLACIAAMAAIDIYENYSTRRYNDESDD